MEVLRCQLFVGPGGYRSGEFADQSAYPAASASPSRSSAQSPSLRAVSASLRVHPCRRDEGHARISPKRRLGVPRAAVDVKEQMREYAAAEKRWQRQVADGKVKALTPKEAGYAHQLADNVLLDVRPAFERNKGWVKDSVWVPAFEIDKSVSPGVLLDKLILFLFGGWWNGSHITKRNERFMADVVAQFPKTSNIIVGCQSGLRSLAACEHLYKAGYRNLSWIRGGFDAAEEEDFRREGPEPLKFAGLGGFSEFIGLTYQQRARAQREGLGYRAVFFMRMAGILVGLDLLFVAYRTLTENFGH